MGIGKNSNIEILEKDVLHNNKKEIFFTFDLNNAEIQSSSFIDLDNISESDSITENISKKIKETFLNLLGTDVEKLELALSNGSEKDFVNALSHYQEYDSNLRKKIYGLVDQSLEQKAWKKSHIKILVRTGILAKNSKDFSIARGYLKKALELKTDINTKVSIKLAYGNCYAKEGRLETAIQIYKNILNSNLKKIDVGNIAWCHHNLGTASIQNKNISQGIIHFKEASRIRAENKQIGEPCHTLGVLAHSLELIDIQYSLSLYDEISSTLEGDMSSSEVIRNRAHAHYGAARLRCLELGSYEQALKDINQAIPLLQHFIEDRDCLAGALNIKAMCLKKIGFSEGEEEVISKRDKLLLTLPTLESALLDKKNKDIEDETIRRKIIFMENLKELDKIPEDELLIFIEEQIDIIEKNSDSSSKIAQAYLLFFYGEKLTRKAQYSLAIDCFSRAKALYPSFIKNNILLSMTLYNNQNYSEAIQVSLD